MHISLIAYKIIVDKESLCSDDVDVWHESTVTKQEVQEVVEKQEIKITTYERILDEMKKNELHCSNETRNVQEKIDEMSAEKSQQKEELNEMQHKAQVCIDITNCAAVVKVGPVKYVCVPWSLGDSRVYVVWFKESRKF